MRQVLGPALCVLHLLSTVRCQVPPQAFGPLTHQGVGPLPHQGVGPLPHQGVGPLPHQGVGPLPHQGVGPLPPQGVGPLPHQGVGPLPPQGVGPRPVQPARDASNVIYWQPWTNQQDEILPQCAAPQEIPGVLHHCHVISHGREGACNCQTRAHDNKKPVKLKCHADGKWYAADQIQAAICPQQSPAAVASSASQSECLTVVEPNWKCDADTAGLPGVTRVCTCIHTSAKVTLQCLSNGHWSEDNTPCPSDSKKNPLSTSSHGTVAVKTSQPDVKSSTGPTKSRGETDSKISLPSTGTTKPHGDTDSTKKRSPQKWVWILVGVLLALLFVLLAIFVWFKFCRRRARTSSQQLVVGYSAQENPNFRLQEQQVQPPALHRECMRDNDMYVPSSVLVSTSVNNLSKQTTQ